MKLLFTKKFRQFLENIFFGIMSFWRGLRIQNSVFSILSLRTQGNWSSEGMASFGFSFWMVRSFIRHIHYHYPTCSFIWKYTVEKVGKNVVLPTPLGKTCFALTRNEKTSEQVVIAAVIFLANILVIAHATRDPYNVRKVISWTTPTRMFSEYW